MQGLRDKPEIASSLIRDSDEPQGKSPGQIRCANINHFKALQLDEQLWREFFTAHPLAASAARTKPSSPKCDSTRSRITAASLLFLVLVEIFLIPVIIAEVLIVVVMRVVFSPRWLWFKKEPETHDCGRDES